MTIKSYYGTKKGTTYLELGVISGENEERTASALHLDQDAYDTYALAVHMKYLLAYRGLLRSERISLEDIPRKEKNLLLYLLLAARPQWRSVFEIGCTLLEVVDGLEVAARYARSTSLPRLSLSSYRFGGVEISHLLAEASRLLHEGYEVEIAEDLDDIKGSYEVLYDRATTSYAFTTASECARFIDRHEASLLNLCLSKEETFISSSLGKSFTFFSLKELAETMRTPLFHLFGRRRPSMDLSQGRPVVEGFFLAAPSETAEEFMRLGRSEPELAAYFDEKGIRLMEATELLSE